VWTVANLAGADAQALHHDWIGLEHLLAALVHPDCPGAARSVLASLGVTAERLRQARERSFVDPFEPPPAPEPPLDPEEAMGRVAPGLELAVTPAGKDPRRRMPWGSRIFVDADGTPIKQTDGQALWQYYIDRDGNPVLTSDGQPVHAVFDEHGREVTDEDGQPLIVPVEIPDGSSVEAPAPST
jgi:hypothetical protein